MTMRTSRPFPTRSASASGGCDDREPRSRCETREDPFIGTSGTAESGTVQTSTGSVAPHVEAADLLEQSPDEHGSVVA